MNVQVKSSSGITLVPMETRLLAQRTVFVEGEITPESACLFVKQLLWLNSEDSREPINVLINSPGGEINSGLLMYDAIQSGKAPVKTYCMGRCYSMGAVLFTCGNHGRYMLPHSELMLHEPLLGNRISGNSSSIKSISDSLIETKSRMNKILAKHTGKTEEEMEQATSFDHYFSPEESLEFGLCDKIVGFDEILGGKNYCSTN